MNIINVGKLLEALDSDMHPMAEVESAFGIEMNVPLGQLIYSVYTEIYKHHIAGGQSFHNLLIIALLAANLPHSFQKCVSLTMRTSCLIATVAGWLVMLDSTSTSIQKNRLTESE
jgi:hypothetical protein